jgi:CRISPR-associated endonuclease/helicase Cas3
MTRPKRLLAKSYDRTTHGAEPPDYALLLQHSRDVAEACKALAASSGPAALFCSDISLEDYDRFYRSLVANGWIQDLGKASSDFQAMVTGNPQIIQLLRHETISGLLMWSEPKFRDWLEPLPDRAKKRAIFQRSKLSATCRMNSLIVSRNSPKQASGECWH